MMPQPLGFEVANAQLDDGVAAVILVEFDGGADPVGDQGVVAPVGEQLGLGADQAGAAHATLPSRRASSTHPLIPLRLLAEPPAQGIRA
jgi:hypothetical protein